MGPGGSLYSLDLFKTLLEHFFSTKAIALDSDRFWFTDGQYSYVYEWGSGFSNFYNLPLGNYYCSLKIDLENFIFISTNAIWRHNFVTNQSQDLLAIDHFPYAPYTNIDLSCGVIKLPNGEQEIVVVPQAKHFSHSVYHYKYNVDKNTWNRSNLMLDVYEGGKIVQYKESFLLVGGRSAKNKRELILKYDITSGMLVEMPQQLNRYAQDPVTEAFLVSDASIPF